MKNKEIFAAVEQFAPLSLAEEWDNVGLMLGSAEAECSGVVVALDLTQNALSKAVKCGCNLIITHHPPLFKAINCINTEQAKGKMIEYAIANKITVYSAHTNLDKTEGGINTELAKKFGAIKADRFDIGVIAEIKPLPLKMLATKISELLTDPTVCFAGDIYRTISKIYIVGGAGGDSEQYGIAKNNADAFITAEVKHHVIIEATNDAFPIVQFSHYASEIIAEDILADLLSDKFSGLKIIKSQQQRPYRTVEEA